jgi:hypothetical protein
MFRVHRTIKFGEGVLNFEIRDDTVVKVSLNFHLRSTSGRKLKTWLQTPIHEAKRVVELVMDKVIGVSVTNVAL